MTLSLTINGYILSLFPHLHTPFPRFSPSLIGLMVSVNVKHRVYWHHHFAVDGTCSHKTVRKTTTFDEKGAPKRTRTGSVCSVVKRLIPWTYRSMPFTLGHSASQVQRGYHSSVSTGPHRLTLRVDPQPQSYIPLQKRLSVVYDHWTISTYTPKVAISGPWSLDHIESHLKLQK